MKALEKMQIIASENGGYYAYRTRLGWCTAEPKMSDHKDFISCHQVAVRDASTSQVALHHFGIKDSLKDITLEEMFKMKFKMVLVSKLFFQAKLWWAAMKCQ